MAQKVLKESLKRSEAQLQVAEMQRQDLVLEAEHMREKTNLQAEIAALREQVDTYVTTEVASKQYIEHLQERIAISVQEGKERMVAADTEREMLSKAHSDLMEEVKDLRERAANTEELARFQEEVEELGNPS